MNNSTELHIDGSMSGLYQDVTMRLLWPSKTVYIKIDDCFARALGFSTRDQLIGRFPVFRGIEWFETELFDLWCQHILSLPRNTSKNGNDH